MSRNRSKFVGQSQVGNGSNANGESETHHQHQHHHHSSGLSSAHHGNNSVFDGGTPIPNGHAPNGQANSSSKRNNNTNNFHSPGGSKNVGKGTGKKSLKVRPDVSTPFKHGSGKSQRLSHMTAITHFGNVSADSVIGQINTKVRYQESQGFSPSSLSRSAEQVLDTDSQSDSSVGKVASESDLKPEESPHTQPALPMDNDADLDSPVISKPKKKRRPSLK